MKPIGGGWDEVLFPLFNSDNYRKIHAFLLNEYRTRVVYPDMYSIYNCFRTTPYDKVKAVLLGQDPYHGPGQAHGLCFSVPDGQPFPPSLRNIFRELQDDVGCRIPRSGNLTKWAGEGVLLLNTALTVREHEPNSHRDCGWTEFTDGVIRILSERKEHLVFLLWGANARSKKALIDGNRHRILECAHPSPLSAHSGFFGCRHFSKTNEYLMENKIDPIDWSLES